MDRWRSRHGKRYLFIDDFIRFCKDLNISTSKKELEHFHKIDLLYPALILRFPDEYIRYFTQMEDDPNHPGWTNYNARRYQYPDEWEEIHNLDHLLRFPVWKHESTLIHPLDRKDVRNKDFIVAPSQIDFQPWDKFHIEVKTKDYGILTPTTIKIFYSYWQVYQLEAIKRNPSWSSYWCVLQQVPEDKRKGYFIPQPRKKGDFLGKNNLFECLSFYVFLRNRQYNLLANQIVNSGKKVMTSQQREWLDSRYAKIARISLKKFSVKVSELEDFLHYFIECLYDDLNRQEKIAMASLCKRDLLYLCGMITLLTGRKFEELKENSKYDRLKWIFKDERQERIRRVRRYFESLSNEYNAKMPTKYQIHKSEVSELVDFLSEDITYWGIFEAIHAINDKFRSSDLISLSQVKDSLGNLCRYLEPFLRGLYRKRDILPNPDTIKTQKDVFINFFAQELEIRELLTQNWALTNFDEDDPGNSFAAKLTNIEALPKTTYSELIAARTLLSLLVRNFLTHRARFYFEEVGYRDKLVEHVFAPLHSMFFAWIYNKKNHEST